MSPDERDRHRAHSPRGRQRRGAAPRAARARHHRHARPSSCSGRSAARFDLINPVVVSNPSRIAAAFVAQLQVGRDPGRPRGLPDRVRRRLRARRSWSGSGSASPWGSPADRIRGRSVRLVPLFLAADRVLSADHRLARLRLRHRGRDHVPAELRVGGGQHGGGRAGRSIRSSSARCAPSGARGSTSSAR